MFLVADSEHGPAPLLSHPVMVHIGISERDEGEDKRETFIHSFIFCSRLSVRVTGGLEPIPADSGREAGYTLDKSPVHRRADIWSQKERETTIHAHIHTYGQFRLIIYPNLHVLGLWEEAGVPEEIPL